MEGIHEGGRQLLYQKAIFVSISNISFQSKVRKESKVPDVTKLTDDEFTDYLVGLGKTLSFCHLFK